jgi:hypothetical protein
MIDVYQFKITLFLERRADVCDSAQPAAPVTEPATTPVPVTDPAITAVPFLATVESSPPVPQPGRSGANNTVYVIRNEQCHKMVSVIRSWTGVQ